MTRPAYRMGTAALVFLLSGTGCFFSKTAEKPEDHPNSNDQKVVDVVENLDEGSAAARIRAAEEAGKLGERAAPAAEQLCALALRSEAERIAALEALEKVHPQLFPHVRTLVTATEDYARSTALAEIGKLGRAGRAALPVVRAQLKQGSDVPTCLRTLALIAPEASATFDAAQEYLGRRPKKKDDYQHEQNLAAAVAALGDVAQAEPTQRQKIVSLLIPQLDGKAKAPAVSALAKCGPEAGKAITKLKSLRFGSAEAAVVQAADAAVPEIEGYVKAAAILTAAASRPVEVAKCAGDTESKWLRQLARERLRTVHPEVERLAAILFEPRPMNYYNPTQAVEAELATIKPATSAAGAAAAPLVDFYAQRPRGAYLAAYQALARLAPDSKDVVQSLIAACNRHVDARRKVVEFNEVAKLPDYWTGAELVALAADEPAVQSTLCDAANALANAGAYHSSEYNSNVTALLNKLLGNLTVLAKQQPESRRAVAAALVNVMRPRAFSSTPGVSIDHDLLETAFLACDQEAYNALQAEDLTKYADWQKRAFSVMRTTQPRAGLPPPTFQVGERVWKKNGGWMLSSQVAEALGKWYRVRTLGTPVTADGDWVTADRLHKPTLPVPKDGYKPGDLVEIEVKEKWLPAKVVGDHYGLHTVVIDGQREMTDAAGDQIRPRQSSGAAQN